MRRVAVIMAGGAGERFWPVSYGGRPKQLLRLISDKTMIEESVARIESLIPPEDIFVVIGEEMLPLAQRELNHYTNLNLIVEPMRRNTTACLALAHARIKAHLGEHTMAVLTADHLIQPPARFCDQVELALETAEREDRLVLMGKRPTRPETGFGYMEVDGTFADGPGGRTMHVKRFKEKPDVRTAMNYVTSGNYLWNCGMFFWRSETFDAALRKHSPKIGAHLDELGTARGENLARIFAALPSLPIDIAIMEKLDDLLVVEADFLWDDIGTWTALERLHGHDPRGNVVLGNALLEDCSNCICYVDGAAPGTNPELAMIGLKNVIVSVSQNRILVSTKDHAQDVKKASVHFERK